MITYLRVKETKTYIFPLIIFFILIDDYLSPSEGDENIIFQLIPFLLSPWMITYLRVKETKTFYIMSFYFFPFFWMITYLRVKETKTGNRIYNNKIQVMMITYLRVKETKTY